MSRRITLDGQVTAAIALEGERRAARAIAGQVDAYAPPVAGGDLLDQDGADLLDSSGETMEASD